MPSRRLGQEAPFISYRHHLEVANADRKTVALQALDRRLARRRRGGNPGVPSAALRSPPPYSRIPTASRLKAFIKATAKVRSAISASLNCALSGS